MREDTIIKKLKEHVKSKGYIAVAEATGVSYGCIWLIVDKGEIKTRRTLKALESYYNNKQ